jgi:tRNA U55 pseudouridine synthase TruB
MGIVALLWLYNSKFKDHNANYKLNCTKSKYIRAVVEWCAQNLGMPPKVRQLPNIEVKYYKHHKILGVYHTSGKQICIYVNGHENLLSLTNTIIHEYQHFLDIRNASDQKDYAKVLATIGYEKHPLEIAARKTADKYQEACFNEMIKTGLITKG